MKILVVSQCYFPEQFRITDICEELVKKGHSVTVLTGKPNYGFPNGEIPQEYKKGRNQEEINGVKVLRVDNRPRKTGAINRLLNYYSFYLKANKVVNKLDNDFDVVLVNQLTPIMQINPAIKYKKKHGAKVVVYCLDLWPESLTVGGFKKGSFIYNHYHKVSEKLYKKVDKILITSKSFADYFKNEFGIDNTEYLPQYAETMFTPEVCKKQPDGKVDLLFAGNVGDAQSVDTAVRAMAKCKDIANLKLHVVGDGVALDKNKQIAKDLGLENVIFYGRKPLDEMPKFYSMADAMLVTLSKDWFSSLTCPGKVQTYMAAGKPIIAGIDGETATVINQAQCGFVTPSEDVDGLAESFRKFVSLENKVSLGENAYEYYVQNFTKESFFEVLLRNF